MFMQPSRGPTVLIVLLASLGMAYYHLGIFIPHAMARRDSNGSRGGYSFGDDFYPIWLTSREALLYHRNPYGADMTQEIQTGLFGHALARDTPSSPSAHYREFAYPVYVDLLFWPLGLLSFTAGRVVLAPLLATLTAMSVLLWMWALRIELSTRALAVAVMLTLSSYAVLEGVFAAQPGLIAGFVLSAAILALVNNRLFLGGTLLAFTFIKPQVSILVAGYLFLWTVSRWRTRRSFLLGLLGWSAVLVTASLVVWPHWISEWVSVLSGYGRYAPPPLITYSLGPKLGPQVGPLLIALLLAAAIVLAWRMRHADATSPLFGLTVSVLLALTSVTLLPGQAVYDHVILLPRIFVIASAWRKASPQKRASRIILIALALAISWQWLTAIPLLIARPLLGDPTFFGRGLWLIPFHAAASVPLAICAVLGYLYAHALRHDRLKGQPPLTLARRA